MMMLDPNQLMPCAEQLSDYYMTRLVVCLLTQSIQDYDFDAVEDPELDFLRSKTGTAIVCIALRDQRDGPKPLIQYIQCQASGYLELAMALGAACEGEYICYPVEIENMLAALIVRNDNAPLVREHLISLLDRKFLHFAQRTAEKQNMRCYITCGIEEKVSNYKKTFGLEKDALRFFDFMRQPRDYITLIDPLAPKPHIDLKKRMDVNCARFVETFLQNDVSAAKNCITQAVEDIQQWIPLSADVFLSDLQYFFDLILEAVSSQFGVEAGDLLLNVRIFDSISHAQLMQNIQQMVEQLFLRVRRNSTDATFQRMAEIRRFINEHLDNYELSANYAAQQFGISPQLLSMQYKKCFGMPPSQYIEQQRIQKVKEYLMNTELTGNQICQAVGIGTVATLHRLFKAHCGMTPGAYRRAVKHVLESSEDI